MDCFGLREPTLWGTEGGYVADYLISADQKIPD